MPEEVARFTGSVFSHRLAGAAAERYPIMKNLFSLHFARQKK
jgi:hypothetical protein